MFGSRINRDGRMLFPFAIAEAQDLGHPSVGPEHLILGVLCNARDPLVGVLAAHGITLASARDAVRGAAEADGGDEPTADEDRYDQDRDALKVLGIDLDQVRRAVRENFGEDLTDRWGRREQRGHRGGPRGRGHRPHRGCDPQEEIRAGGPRRPGRGPWGPDGGPWGQGPWGEAEGPWDYGRGRRGPRGHGRRPRFTTAAREAMSEAVRIAAEHGDGALSTVHIALGALRSDSPAVAAIIALAPDAATLRQAVADQLTATAEA